MKPIGKGGRENVFEKKNANIARKKGKEQEIRPITKTSDRKTPKEGGVFKKRKENSTDAIAENMRINYS